MSERGKDKPKKRCTRCEGKSREQLEKQVLNLQSRASFAEMKLSSIASIPNDSRGWITFRKQQARKALRELLDVIEAEDEL